MRDHFIGEIQRLRNSRQQLVREIYEEAKTADGTYAGAVEYLKLIQKDCIQLDDDARGSDKHIDAYAIWRDALDMLNNFFNEDTERRKYEKIW